MDLRLEAPDTELKSLNKDNIEDDGAFENNELNVNPWLAVLMLYGIVGFAMAQWHVGCRERERGNAT